VIASKRRGLYLICLRKNKKDLIIENSQKEQQMKETKGIIKLFHDLYNGSPWVGVNILSTVQGISADQAAKKVFPKWNSIWEITNHVVSWRQNVMRRIQGEVIITPDHNYFTPVSDTSDIAWNHTLQKLEDSQQQWLLVLSQLKENDLERIYQNNNMTFYENIHGLIQHDAYHLGQIAMLAKAL
jgi:uncharacterized damage-inducible protein DinB